MKFIVLIADTCERQFRNRLHFDDHALPNTFRIWIIHIETQTDLLECIWVLEQSARTECSNSNCSIALTYVKFERRNLYEHFLFELLSKILFSSEIFKSSQWSVCHISNTSNEYWLSSLRETVHWKIFSLNLANLTKRGWVSSGLTIKTVWTFLSEFPWKLWIVAWKKNLFLVLNCFFKAFNGLRWFSMMLDFVIWAHKT